MPGARRNWWKRPQVMPLSSPDEGSAPGRRQMISSGRAQARITQSTLDGSIDSPLCRARMAAESQRIAEQLAVLEQEGTRPDLIVELRSTLLSVRAQLCGAS